MFYVEKVRAWEHIRGALRPDWVVAMIVAECPLYIEFRSPPDRDLMKGVFMDVGQWLVRRPSGDFAILSDADFRESYDPVIPPMVYMSYDPPSVGKA